MSTLMVTGSRTLNDDRVRKTVFEFLDDLHRQTPVTKRVSGNAAGIDRIAEEWANSKEIPVHRCFPNWRQYGRGAGVIRNKEMVDISTCVLAFWDGRSRGTRSAIDEANRKNKLKKVLLVHSS
jgi:hypothetical protein